MSFICDKKINGKFYRYKVETYYVNGKPRQRILEYFGRVVREGSVEKIIKPRTSIESFDVEYVRSYGNLMLLYTIADEIEIVESINEVCNNSETGKAILLLAINRILGRRPLRKIAKWYYNSALNPLFGEPKNFSKDKLLGAMDTLCDFDESGNMADFTSVLQLSLWKKQAKFFESPKQGLFYDITPIIVYGIENSLFKHGRKTLGKSYREFHAGLVIDRKTTMPVLLKAFRGNLSDMQTVSEILPELKERGINKCYVIFDRGMKSKENIDKILALGLDLIAGVPSSHQESDIIDEINDEKLLQVENRIERRSGYSYVLGIKKSFNKKTYQLVLALNPKLREVQREIRHQNVNEAKAELQKLSKECSGWTRIHLIKRVEAITNGVNKYVECNIRKVEDVNKLYIKIDQKKLTEELKRDGKFVIMSSDLTISPKEVFSAYFQKDEIEKAFRTFKGELDFIPTRHYLEKRVIVHLAIGYISYLLYSLLHLKLKKAKLDISPSECLEKLEDIKEVIIRRQDKVFRKLTLLTKEQKEILSKLGLSRLAKISVN